ncbi:hypothetical protein PENTCL1PPCAC_6886 [Pristionchus entomophagus]|uniref:Uncharacterized protein n=1 Tax=Pristionchus entomophagus TaxID=358040 RepID=A0AAV5SYV6_9BILA|nr:hypothetical protein PENTCL1PPCAC_6886 [Pristionchus entomophagus]
MHSSFVLLFCLLALPTANSRFIDSILQNMDAVKQHMHSQSEENPASSEEVEGSGSIPERHHQSKRELNDEAAELLLSVMKRDVNQTDVLLDDGIVAKNLTTAPIRPAIVNGIWTFLDEAH